MPRAHLLLVALTLALAPSNAAAAPYSGEGTAPATDGKDGPAHRVALERARRAALEEALDGLPGPVDATVRADVLAQAAAWTGAYRVLEQRDDGATVTVRVEVNVDVARLAKRLAPPTAGRKQGPTLRSLELGSACAATPELRGWLEQELVAQAGLVREGTGPAVKVRLDCRALGPVPFTHLHAQEIRARATLDGEPTADAVVHGFDVGEAAAARAGLARALGRLASRLQGTLDGVLLRVEPGAPAAAVRRVVKALGSSVVGVEGAELVGLDVDGGIRIRVSSGLDGQALADRLRALSLPGISVTIIRHDAHRLSIALG